jgi:hypothetical protein
MCFDFLYKFCPKHFSFYEEMSEILSKMYIGIHVKYRLFLSDFDETWNFSTDFLKKKKTLKYQISWKSVQWEPSFSMRKDRRTDMTKIIVDFRNSANAPPPKKKHVGMYSKIYLTAQGRSQGREGDPAQQVAPFQSKFKARARAHTHTHTHTHTHRFCKHDSIICFSRHSLQPKSATGIGW